ncbi:MAG: hypothetical protein R2717_02490 [Schumannella sp.]
MAQPIAAMAAKTSPSTSVGAAPGDTTRTRPATDTTEPAMTTQRGIRLVVAQTNRTSRTGAMYSTRIAVLTGMRASEAK